MTATAAAAFITITTTAPIAAAVVIIIIFQNMGRDEKNSIHRTFLPQPPPPSAISHYSTIGGSCCVGDSVYASAHRLVLRIKNKESSVAASAKRKAGGGECGFTLNSCWPSQSHVSFPLGRRARWAVALSHPKPPSHPYVISPVWGPLGTRVEEC